jgi:hypothetical protein
MKYCNKCHVKVRTNQKYCPLCHQVLEGENEEAYEVFPSTIPEQRPLLPITKKILLFITVVSILALFVTNLLIYNITPYLWCLIPIGSILYFWMIVRYGIISKQNIAFKLALLTTILIIILNLIDQTYTSIEEVKGWALNYVTPLALNACSLAISFIIWIKRINYREYLIYLITILVFSIVPMILNLFDIVTIAWPSIVSSSSAFLILLFIIFFFPKSIKDEIKKRFHI